MAGTVKCPSCAYENAGTSRFCGSCAAPLDASSAPTVALPPTSSAAPLSRVEEGRFLPGTLLNGRYRVIGLLGKGGMGEVYRATDLALGQQVALKFLFARDEGSLARFYSEVRIARQVSHPNVCRVYDIGEVNGQAFISMEYVDGEDLGSLLRRIGRLPPDKAVEIARRLCAGLAAAHEKGILHRDLKPANIMIDGRGQVLIMDFGLAAAAGEIADLHSGTPAYMAPEQLAGREVTVRSDIYALGLVLHEMFTGKLPGEGGGSTALDPAVDQIIHRCLAQDPGGRPATALAVAAALPGGDPLAAALAAGETPSPELVAAAGEGESLPVRAACLWLAAALIGLAVAWVLAAERNLLNRIPFDNPPEALAQQARELLRRFGYTARPLDSIRGYDYDGEYFDHVRRHKSEAGRFLHPPEFPAMMHFWYRQSPRRLAATYRESFAPGWDDPPHTVSGMVRLRLDTQGRLVAFEAVPPQLEDPAPAPPFDWGVLFTAAGLDRSRFTPTEPKWTPLANWDARAAWTGPAGPYTLRVEAAAWRGKPVSFSIIGPWTRPGRMEERQRSASERAGAAIVLVTIYAALAFACVLAWRNMRLDRSDRRGAARLAAVMAVMHGLLWLTAANHVPEMDELGQFWVGVSAALVNAATMWVVYVALEPYVRRRWPQTMIGWTRVLSGHFRDPVVGRDVLVGCAAGMALLIVEVATTLLSVRMGASSGAVYTDTLLGVPNVVKTVLSTLLNSIGNALIFLFVIVLLRVLLRRAWLAAAVFVALLGAAIGLLSPLPQVDVAFGLAFAGLYAFTLVRYGVLAAVALNFSFSLMTRFPLTTDFGAWYASIAFVGLAMAAALMLFAFRAALGGRKLWGGALLE
ncbi:MAG: protein kinase [Bryobacteraceae bacterium]